MKGFLVAQDQQNKTKTHTPEIKLRIISTRVRQRTSLITMPSPFYLPARSEFHHEPLLLGLLFYPLHNPLHHLQDFTEHLMGLVS